VYVIDSTDRKRLLESKEELGNLLEESQLAGIPLLVFANKVDLMMAIPADEISETLTLHMIRDRPWSIVGCSAKTGEGLQEGLEWLIHVIQQ
jgi:ADP-ribosylation factor-like protein 3